MSIESLLERLEKATGPSRFLDCLTQQATVGKYPFDSSAWRRTWETSQEVEYAAESWKVPRYTASLDAALSLLPEGYAVNSLTIWHGCPSSVTILGTAKRPFGKDRRVTFCHTATDGKWTAEAATPALAVSAAALKARADDPQSERDMEAGR